MYLGTIILNFIFHCRMITRFAKTKYSPFVDLVKSKDLYYDTDIQNDGFFLRMHAVILYKL